MTETSEKGMAGEIPVYCAFDEIVPLEDMKPNPKNPNQHPDDQIELLAKIIQAQGWRAPVTVSTLSGMIVRGHGRYMAAQLIGCPVPVDFQHYENEDAELADLLADNRIAELAEIDNDMLADIMASFEDIDLDLTGYDDDAVAALLEAVEDDPEEIPGEVPFTEVLREEHNYIVLYFDNEVDWLQAESLFALESVKSLATRTDGKVSEKAQRKGLGRVLNGAKALEVLRDAYKLELSFVQEAES